MKNSYLDKIGLNALNASRNLSLLNEKKKNKVLKDFYKNFKQIQKRILKANKTDISRANKNKVRKIWLIDYCSMNIRLILYLIRYRQLLN